MQVPTTDPMASTRKILPIIGKFPFSSSMPSAAPAPGQVASVPKKSLTKSQYKSNVLRSQSSQHICFKSNIAQGMQPPDVNMDEGTWTTPMGMPITVVTTMAISSELLILYSLPPVLMRRKYSMKHMTILTADRSTEGSEKSPNPRKSDSPAWH